VLQSLAATIESLDAANFDAVDPADLLSAEDDEDDAGEDLESSLAFLSALLNASAPKNSPGGFETGAQGQGPADDGANTVPVKTTSGDSPAGFALNAESSEQKSEVALNLAAVRPEPLEIRAGGDAAQNLARAAELLMQAPRPAAPTEQPTMTTHVRDPRWADDLGARVSLMVRAGESSATLALTPVDLGPVEINVTVKDSQATIHFGASQADTRALLEASLPRLREMLAAQGFNLTDASVSSGFSRSQQQASSQGSRPGEAEISLTEAPSVRHLGLLDLYA
jgi:flagellar hook-length control protein FliK